MSRTDREKARLRKAWMVYRATREGGEADDIDGEEFIASEHASLIASGERGDPELFPELYNLSAGFLYRFAAVPRRPLPPEFVYVPSTLGEGRRGKDELLESLFVTQWNICWESGHLRHSMFEGEVPKAFKWLQRYDGQNIFLLPRAARHRYFSLVPLYHLLPKRLLHRHGLPQLSRGLWPHYQEEYWREAILPGDFDSRLSRAFADLVWPKLNSGSGHLAL